MKDPVRDPGDWTPFERELLDAAMRDQIPPELEARMAEGLAGSIAGGSAAASGGGGSAATGAGAPVGGLLFAKTTVIGVASALLIGGAVTWQVLRGADPEPERVPDRQSEVRQLPPTAPSQPSAASPALGSVAHDGVPAADGVMPTGVRGVALREEIALLDLCRRAVRERASARALDLLARYDVRFPAGTFAPEAAALRIEALVQSGARLRARALAREFLSAHPASPLAQRVEELVGSAAIP